MPREGEDNAYAKLFVFVGGEKHATKCIMGDAEMDERSQGEMKTMLMQNYLRTLGVRNRQTKSIMGDVEMDYKSQGKMKTMLMQNGLRVLGRGRGVGQETRKQSVLWGMRKWRIRQLMVSCNLHMLGIRWNSWLAPFDLALWLSIVGFVNIILVVLWWIDRKSPTGHFRQLDSGEDGFTLLGTLTFNN